MAKKKTSEQKIIAAVDRLIPLCRGIEEPVRRIVLGHAVEIKQLLS